MPRKARKPKPALVGTVATLLELVDAIGIHRNTLTIWKREGAPKGPPYSVVEWYAWAKAAGKRDVQLPRDPDLARLCRGASKPPAPPATPPADLRIPLQLISIGKRIGIDPPDEYDMSEGDRTLAWQRWAQSVRAAQDILERDGKLITLDRFRSRLSAIRDRVLEQLLDVHGVARAVTGLTHQQRGELRDGLSGWLTATRQRMTTAMNLSPLAAPPIESPDAAG